MKGLLLVATLWVLLQLSLQLLLQTAPEMTSKNLTAHTELYQIINMHIKIKEERDEI